MKQRMKTIVMVCLTAGSLTFGSFSASAATLAYWEFESGSFLTDSSGNGHTLANTGATESTYVIAGGPGTGSALFDGVGNFMNTVSTLDLSGETQLTIEWSMASNVGGTDYAWGHGESPGGMRAYINADLGSGVTGVQPLQDLTGGEFIYTGAAIPGGVAGNTWNRYVMEIDSTDPSASGIKLFVNGSDVGVFGSSAGTLTATGFLNTTFDIGVRSAGFGFFGGNIDNFRISSGLLDPSMFLVPEPSTAVLLGLGGLLLLGRRKSRNPAV